MVELAEAGAVAFSDDGRPVRQQPPDALWRWSTRRLWACPWWSTARMPSWSEPV